MASNRNPRIWCGDGHRVAVEIRLISSGCVKGIIGEAQELGKKVQQDTILDNLVALQLSARIPGYSGARLDIVAHSVEIRTWSHNG